MKRDSRWTALAFLFASFMGLSVGASGCRVPPPTLQEWVQEAGFRDPAQTFETFRMAFRGDLLEWEYRCLSANYRDRHNGLSQMAYRTVRDDLLAQEPLLKLALHRAKVEKIDRSGRQARLEAHVAGHTLVVHLVREDFWEIWADRDLMADDYVASLFENGPAEIVEHNGSPWFVGRLPLETPLDPARITEVRLGMEWKIDRFQMLEEAP